VPNYKDFLLEGEDPNNYICGLGIQHRKHYVEDFKLLKSLNINAFRFSIE
jgi:beta-glucosidase/6-phospho-beta-glucosidase/beta-galactosidase